jgi:hypothetical protein
MQAAARAEKKAARTAAAASGGSGRVHMAMPTLGGMHSARRERNSFKHRRLFSDAPGALKVLTTASAPTFFAPLPGARRCWRTLPFWRLSSVDDNA